MTTLLKQSTQRVVRIGPFVDVGDGFTPETGVAASTADEAELLKATGGVVSISAATWAAITTADGWYDLTLTTSHTDTLGELLVIIQDDSVCLPVHARFMVVTANYWDSLFSTDVLNASVTQWLGTAVTAATAGVPNVNTSEVSGDSTAADNLESACDNYSVTRGLTGTALPAAVADAAGGVPISDAGGLDLDAILVDTGTTIPALLPAALVGGRIDANVGAISADATAADNLELMYDGTGYTDETGPASRSQVDNIGASSGAALNYEASADNTAGAIIDGVTIVGSITANLFTDTDVENGTRHQLTHATNAFDFVYRLPVGGGRTAATCEWRGYLTSSNDACSIQAYDHVGVAWDTVGTISGTNGTANSSHIVTLLSKHTGTGSELGNVYIRFICTAQTSPVLNTDLLLVQAVNIGQSVGYANGAIWIDTVNGVNGTENYVNGVADNPVDTIAAALTISSSLNIQKFEIASGSTITFAASVAGKEFSGENWTLALGNQAVGNCTFRGSTDVSGLSSGDNIRFYSCHIKTVTIGTVWASDCRLGGTVTLQSTGGHFFQSCYASTGTIPIIDLGAVGAQTLCLTPLTGGVDIRNTAAGDLVHIEGAGEILLDSTCNGGTLEYSGSFRFTDNSTSITVNPDDNTVNIAATLVDTGTTIPGTITTLQADTDDIQTRLPAALVGGAMDSYVSVIQTSAAQTIRDEILPTQNVAFSNIEFLWVAASDHVTPVTGASTTSVTRSIDGGAFGSGTGTLAEVGNGIYQYDASQADMNGGIITFRFVATGGTPGAPDDAFLTIVTGGGV